jgi:hypothetical protein
MVSQMVTIIMVTRWKTIHRFCSHPKVLEKDIQVSDIYFYEFFSSRTHVISCKSIEKRKMSGDGLEEKEKKVLKKKT